MDKNILERKDRNRVKLLVVLVSILIFLQVVTIYVLLQVNKNVAWYGSRNTATSTDLDNLQSKIEKRLDLISFQLSHTSK